MDIKRLVHYASMAPIGVIRYSGQYLIRPESVPDHCASCTTLAIMILKDLDSIGFKVNREKLIYKISIHDLPEHVTSDIIRPLKYHHEELRREFQVAEEDMIRRAGYPEDLIDEILHAKDDGSTEGYLLRFIDILQVVCKLREEVEELGNNLIAPEYKSAVITLKSILEESHEFGESDILYNYLSTISNLF